MPGTRKLGRPTAHRNSMLRGMVTYLLENGTIETTVYRAKEVRSMTEKMITLGKKNTLASRRAALSYITKKEVVKKLFDQIAPEYHCGRGRGDRGPAGAGHHRDWPADERRARRGDPALFRRRRLYELFRCGGAARELRVHRHGAGLVRLPL